MTAGWIGIGTPDRARFDLRGLSLSGTSGASFVPAPAPVPNALLATGTLVLEAQVSALREAVQRLVHLRRHAGWERCLTISLSKRRQLLVECRQDHALCRAQTLLPALAHDARLRITYTWNAPLRHGVISVEDLDQETLHQVEMPDPLPLPLDDLARIMRRGPGVQIDAGTHWVALSDRVEPVGLPLGVGALTPVETPEGLRPINRLRPGDMVLTPNGPHPIRWITRREVPALGAQCPIHLRTPYHGLACDILVAPDHRLVVAGTETEYLFGKEAVLVKAHHLLDGRTVHHAHGGGLQEYVHVLLDDHACLNFAGMQGESLFVSGMGRDPALIATTALAGMPAPIPRHRTFARPPLSSYEARTLAALRAA